jgi:sulfite exporter TauE/SafE
MTRSKLRLNPITEIAVYLTFGCLLITGVVWMVGQSAFDQESSSYLSGWLMKIHGAAAMVALVLFGLLFNHVRKGWKARKNRSSGLTLLLVILFLVVTGYGLYYAGDEQLRAVISQWHSWIGLGLFLLLPAHVAIGRALRRKRHQTIERAAVRRGDGVVE